MQRRKFHCNFCTPNGIPTSKIVPVLPYLFITSKSVSLNIILVMTLSILEYMTTPNTIYFRTAGPHATTGIANLKAIKLMA